MNITKTCQICRINIATWNFMCNKALVHASASPQEPQHTTDDYVAQKDLPDTKQTPGYKKKISSKIQITSSPPTKIDRDWIGPPNQYSNLRPTIYHVPENETALEKEFRTKREEFYHFNHDFWSRHNENFTKQKSAFIANRLSQMDEPRPTKLSAEELSEFYRLFLDENRAMHRQYNKDLYKKNVALLWPALKVKIEQLFVTRRHRKM